MLNNLSKVCASVDNLKPVAQRERQAIIDTKNSRAMCYVIRRKRLLYSMQWAIKRKQIDIDEWIQLSVKTQSLLYGNSLD
jgi:hypothetical protein